MRPHFSRVGTVLQNVGGVKCQLFHNIGTTGNSLKGNGRFVSSFLYSNAYALPESSPQQVLV